MREMNQLHRPSARTLRLGEDRLLTADVSKPCGYTCQRRVKAIIIRVPTCGHDLDRPWHMALGIGPSESCDNMTESMTYTKDDLDQIQTEYKRLPGKCDSLFWDYYAAGQRFDIERAREYAHHGFCRRLKTLEHCIVRIFETIPPDYARQPDEPQLLDVTIFLQAFVFNVYGCIDNLAHIWVQERKVKKPDGREVSNSAVGFGKNNSDVLNSLPNEFRGYITSFEHQRWYRTIGDFRNALAHRIPPYIPPFVVRREDMSKFNRVGSLVDDAVERGNYAEACKLMNEQQRIGIFVPGVTHSFAEGSRPILFHAQVLADFNTVAEVARRLLRELCGWSQ